VIRLGDGREVGSASFQATAAGVLVTADLSGLPAGTHAMHFHTIGVCTAPDFASASGHFNPTTRLHGLRNTGGPHAGDLPNIHVPESGALRVEVVASMVSLGPGQGTLGDADGSSIVIHALADDYQTDPAGGSGARIACGVIER
jgi:Cu-Zn family superoxide dismutase